jgi:hypothetical protein
MKYLIAHRGNVHGKDESRENHPDYIMEAVNIGFDVEIDVWVLHDNKIYLGHDAPQYEIQLEFLFNKRLWCHAKNYEALTLMIKHKDIIHCFYHNSDNYILTSRGIIWSYTGKPINEETICVMPENCNNYSTDELKNCLGICSDKVGKYRELYDF